ncbi:MAG: carbohydrate-binding family V/XII [bacterium]|nr:carbohydrate-binding family V/XII [bacterium]
MRRSRLLVSSALALVGCLLCGLPALAIEDDPGWPREITHEKGTVLIYQPHVESLEGDDIRSRAAFSVQLVDSDDDPKFGVLWSEARLVTDRDNRSARVEDLVVTDVRFPDVTEDQIERFMRFVTQRTQGSDLVISLDRVLADLAENEEQREQKDKLGTRPPKIHYSSDPAVLIFIDGDPRYRSIEDGKLKQVANSPYTIVQDPKKKKYYLDGGIEWYEAADALGPWTVTDKPPKKIRKLRPEEEQQAAEEARRSDEAYRAPRVIVSTEPAELIVTDGKAEYSPVEGVELLHVSNAEIDVLLDVATQRHFVVFSGRWYTSKSLEGPWSYVESDDLPDDFVEIPPESDQGDLLVFVAGTRQAREAALDNQIPQTAAVKRGTVRLAIDYDGQPRFKKIDGTGMEYAINTSYSVLKIDGKYWVCHQAVWYVGDKPEGPFAVADFRPDDIDGLPPSNPHYNTKYVDVYDSTPDVVYVGYTSGYVGSYVHGGCVVYGTGWYYTPWYGRYYYPYTSTWGFNMSYNPWYGWGVGVTWSNGPFSITIGGYGGWGGGYPYGGWWGPSGYAYMPVYRGGPRYGYTIPDRWGNGPGARPGIDGRPGASTRPAVSERLGDVQPGARPGVSTRTAMGGENLYNRPANRDRMADRGGRPQAGPATDRPNNVFAGKDGGVYRRTSEGKWQQRQGSDWKQGGGASRAGLERDYRSRTRGSQRTGSYQGNRAPSRPTTRPTSRPMSRGRR